MWENVEQKAEGKKVRFSSYLNVFSPVGFILFLHFLAHASWNYTALSQEANYSPLTLRRSQDKKHQPLSSYGYSWHEVSDPSFKAQAWYHLLHGLTGRISCSSHIREEQSMAERVWKLSCLLCVRGASHLASWNLHSLTCKTELTPALLISVAFCNNQKG